MEEKAIKVDTEPLRTLDGAQEEVLNCLVGGESVLVIGRSGKVASRYHL
jgi:hypothetical protein